MVTSSDGWRSPEIRNPQASQRNKNLSAGRTQPLETSFGEVQARAVGGGGPPAGSTPARRTEYH